MIGVTEMMIENMVLFTLLTIAIIIIHNKRLIKNENKKLLNSDE